MTRARARQGSEAMSHDSANLATPDIKWLGVTARVCRVCVCVCCQLSPRHQVARGAAPPAVPQGNSTSAIDSLFATSINNSLLV